MMLVPQSQDPSCTASPGAAPPIQDARALRLQQEKEMPQLPCQDPFWHTWTGMALGPLPSLYSCFSFFYCAWR